MKLSRWPILIFTLVALVPIHGYFATTISLMRNASRGGVYPNLDQAIESTVGNLEDYREYYRNVNGVEIIHKGPNSPRYAFIWAVGVKVHADGFADGRPFLTGQDEGLTFFVHTRDGWIQYPEDLWIDLDLLGFWMNIFRLYGTET